jgi:hypothetical protein
MIVKRGAKAYQYQSSRVNGEVKTIYQRTVSAQELQEHEKHKEVTQQHRQREQELAQLQEVVNQELSALEMMKRAQLLTIGLKHKEHTRTRRLCRIISTSIPSSPTSPCR